MFHFSLFSSSTPTLSTQCQLCGYLFQKFAFFIRLSSDAKNEDLINSLPFLQTPISPARAAVFIAVTYIITFLQQMY